MTARPPTPFLLGDVVRLRRPHPCGGDEWLVDRLGADLGLRCRRCGRHVLVERARVERRLVAFVARGDERLTAAVTGAAEPAEPAGPVDRPGPADAARDDRPARPSEPRSAS